MFSLRNKILFFTFIAVIVSITPIIILSYQNIYDVSIKHEVNKFEGIISSIEGDIETRYLVALASIYKRISEQKKDMNNYSKMIKNIIYLYGKPFDKKLFNKIYAIITDGIALDCTFFDVSKNKLYTESEITRDIYNRDVYDSKKIKLSKYLDINNSDLYNGTFSIFKFDEYDNNVLVLFNYLCDKKIIFTISMDIGHLYEEYEAIKKDLIKGIQDKIDNINVFNHETIAILHNHKILAGKGMLNAMKYVSDETLDEVKLYSKKMWVVEEGYEDVPPSIMQIAYFKPLDWYILSAANLDDIKNESKSLVRYLIIIALVFFGLCLIVIWGLTSRVTKPLCQLTERVQDITKMDLTSSTSNLAQAMSDGLLVNQNDEVGQLAKAFRCMGGALDENIRSLMETTTAKERMLGELNAARDIQMGILPPPSSVPCENNFILSVMLEPAKEVGGDLYDFFFTPDGRRAVVVGDVSDKGVPAALFMSMTLTLVRYAIQEGLGLDEVLRRVNNSLSENNPSCMFVTLLIGIFNPSTGDLEFANGGHCPFYIINPKAHSVRCVSDVTGPLVGAMPDMDYSVCRTHIEVGERCLFYTDGVSEAMNSKHEMFGENGIVEYLSAHSENTPQEVIEGLNEAVSQYRKDAPQSDDITMLCFSRGV